MIKLLRKITPKFVFNCYHKTLPFLGALIYRFPAKKIKVIGVTGTNGKTTTVEMISAILRGCGFKVATMSSIKFDIDGNVEPNMLKMTMPGRFIIQKTIRRAVDSGCQYIVLEVTSEGIKQFRHRCIDFYAVVMTNLSPEHIESHGGFDNYKNAKGELFRLNNNIHILNIDDEHFEFFSGFFAKKKYSYGIGSGDVSAVDVKTDASGSNFKIDGVEFKTSFPGEFNVYNSLAAISLGLSLGLDLNSISKSLSLMGNVEGRMEEIVNSPFRVIVDYAFTPNALEKVYQTIKKDFKPNKMICVLGACGGGRDKWKRPVLGKIADNNCDSVIITNEDPYDEDPIEIINQVAKDVDNPIKIEDRREAINKAISIASSGDCVIITGKGCEPWICVADGKKIAWDDRQVVREEINKIL